jgi:hypothetical protein
MRVFGAILLAVVCTAAVLFGVGIVVCVLAIATRGSATVLMVGATVGIPFALYCGYRAARSVLN